MDFGALPPEINSARIYSGPGPGPMLAAASAWDQLAQELNSSAVAYGAVITGLTGSGWRGPSSMMMTSAIAPYVAWMHSTAAQAEQTAIGATTAAGAYQSVYAMTVPPPLIAANRSLLMSLSASNFFGQNSQAIAATEAAYDEMWAQDAAAMYGYAASSSTASTLTPFTDPPRTTDSAGVAAQTAALAPLTPVDILTNTTATTSAIASTTSASFSGSAIGVTNNAVAINAMRDDAQGIGPFLAGSAGPLAPTRFANAVPPVAAGMGRASLVGTLSVPQTWAATATLPTTPTAPLPATPAVSGTMPAGMFGEALLGTLAGRGVSNVAAKLRAASVVPRSPAAG